MMWVRTTIRLETEGEVQKREKGLDFSRDEAEARLLHSCQKYQDTALTTVGRFIDSPKLYTLIIELYAL